MKTAFLNAKAVKQYALHVAQTTRAHKFERVGSDFIEAIDHAVRSAIVERIKSAPSKGKTLQ